MGFESPSAPSQELKGTWQLAGFPFSSEVTRVAEMWLVKRVGGAECGRSEYFSEIRSGSREKARNAQPRESLSSGDPGALESRVLGVNWFSGTQGARPSFNPADQPISLSTSAIPQRNRFCRRRTDPGWLSSFHTRVLLPFIHRTCVSSGPHEFRSWVDACGHNHLGCGRGGDRCRNTSS